MALTQAPTPPPQAPRRPHSRVAMAQGLDADQHSHCVPGPRPSPALRLPVVCRDILSAVASGGQGREGRGLGLGA